MGSSDAVGEISHSRVKKQAALRALPLEHPLKLCIGQKILILHLKLPHSREMRHDALHKLSGRISGGVHHHHVQSVRFGAHHAAHRSYDQPFLENQKELPLLALIGFIDQSIINSLSKLFPAVALTDHLCVKLEQLLQQLDDRLLHSRLLLLRQQSGPHALSIPHNGPVLRQGVADQPAGADSQEMVDRLRRIVCHSQLLFYFRKGLLAEGIVQPSMHVISFVADGCHIDLLLGKMLHGMALEEFDPLLICPFALLIVLIVGSQLIHDTEKLPMLPIDNLHT